MISVLFLIIAIYAGSQVGGIGLGVFGAFGLMMTAFITGLIPTEPPTEVLLVILSVVSAAGTLEVLGGVDLLVRYANRFLEKRTRWITFLGPLVCYMLTFFSGTGHVVYAVLPVIARVSRECGVRPERPLAVSVIASQQAVTASPISAATLALATLLSPYGFGIFEIMMVSVPATLIGVLASSLVMFRYGPDISPYVANESSVAISDENIDSRVQVGFQPAKLGLFLFLAGVVAVVAQSHFRDSIASLPSTKWIQLVMLSVCALLLLLDVSGAKRLPQSKIFIAGIQAMVALLGIAWFGDSVLQNYLPQISGWVLSFVDRWPVLFTIGQFLLSIGLFSQAATVRAVTPTGLALGISPLTALVSFTAVNGYFVLPNYPTMVAAMEFDESGTTRVGKWLLNHSFMLPGLVSVIVSIAVGKTLVSVYKMLEFSVFVSVS